MSSIKIITTADGSHSLLNESLNETYHSVHGAVQESLHVFIKHGLDYFLEQYGHKDVSILEVGFGTGLNALLTLQRAQTLPCSIHYITLEAHPIPEDVWKGLNYQNLPGIDEYFIKLHTAPWDSAQDILPNFRLHKMYVKLQEVVLPSAAFDIIYYDAFAPSKQPEMWEFAMLQKIAAVMKKESVFVTYCAKGQLKRDLKTLGFEVMTLEGPPGKKEMIMAINR